MPQYLPYEERRPDTQYCQLVSRIMTTGELVPTRQGPDALTLMQQTMHFDLANGFPILVERSLKSFWRKPIAELCAFINGAVTLEELERFGCDWWGPWATLEKTSKRQLPPGNLGPGSYGGAFRSFPVTGGGFDQFEHLVRELITYPDNRTHMVSPWIPPYHLVRGPQQVIAPCHGWIHVRVLNDRLHLHMFQRSADVPVGVPANMIQYAALLLMLEQLTGHSAGRYYHTMSDAHIYENQTEAMARMLAQAHVKERKLPTVNLTREGQEITDIHHFRAEHFELADYDPHLYMKVPVSP